MTLLAIDRSIPIKSYGETELNQILLVQFAPWVSGLLSLEGEVSANRLKNALPAIKERCWQMGFVEIKKMLEMYADSKLSVKPKSNYFDRVLLGQIVEAYRKEKMTRTKPIEKDSTENHVDKLLDEYKETNEIRDEWVFLYDELRKKGKLPAHTTKYQVEVRNRATERWPNYKSIKNKCKIIVLEDFIKERL